MFCNVSPKVGEEDSGADYYRVLEGLGQPSQANTGVMEDQHILYQENNGKVAQEREKSLNQNVFGIGKKVLVLPKPSEGLVYDEEAFNADVFQGEEGTLQVVQGFKPSEELGEEVRQENILQPNNVFVICLNPKVDEEADMESSVLEFEGGGSSREEGAVVFGEHGEMEMEAGPIFFLPTIVGEEQLEEAMGEP